MIYDPYSPSLEGKRLSQLFEVPLMIVSKTIHDVTTILSKDAFLNREKKSKNVFPIILSFSIFRADKLPKSYQVYIRRNNFCLPT